jgi:hypothetical protein
LIARTQYNSEYIADSRAVECKDVSKLQMIMRTELEIFFKVNYWEHFERILN